MGLLRTLHGWVGVVVALALALIAFTGALSVFADDVARFAAPKAGPSAPDTATPGAATLGAALQAFEGRGGGAIRVARLAPYGAGVHRLYLRTGGGAYIDAHGRVIRSWSAPGRFDEWIVALHHQFLLGGKGERLAGLVGVAAFGMGVSGLIIFLPAWRRFSLRVWPASGTRRDLLAVHRSLGVILAIPLLVQTATGATMVFEGPLKRVLGLEAAQPPPLKAQAPVTGPTPWPRVLAAAEAASHGAAILAVSTPSEPDGLYKISVGPAGGGTATTILVDASTGQAVQPPPAPKPGLAAQIFDGLLNLHSGAWGGLPARIALAVAALGLGSTSLFGAWAFLQRKPRRGPGTSVANPG